MLITLSSPEHLVKLETALSNFGKRADSVKVKVRTRANKIINQIDSANRAAAHQESQGNDVKAKALRTKAKVLDNQLGKLIKALVKATPRIIN